MKRRVGIYLRVSTDGQTTENQRRELEAVAARSGWEVVDFYEDAGISGSNGREKRPGLDRLLKDATARRINMIAAWSVDRLPPPPSERLKTIPRSFQNCGDWVWHPSPAWIESSS